MEELKFINGHPVKRALICYVLLKNGPMPRIAIMKAVHALEASKLAFRPTSNICYFSKDKYGNPWCRHDYTKSVLISKHGRPALLARVGTSNRFHVYGLTAEGHALALKVQEYYAH